MRTFIRKTLTEQSEKSGRSDGLRPSPLGVTTYAASVVINMLTLALPLTILQVYDRVLPNASFETLSALILLLAFAVFIDFFLKYFRSLGVNWAAASFTHKLSTNALSAMLTEKPSKFSQTNASEHLERINSITGLGAHHSGQSRTVIVDILFVPVFSIVIILIGGALFGAVVALFSVFGYLAFKGTKKLNETISDREAMDEKKQDFIIEVLRAIQTVKACAMEPQIMRRYERLQSAASVVTRRMIVLTGAAQTYNYTYASLSTVAIVSTGAILVLNGRLTLGALACCMLLSSQLLQPLMRSLASWNEVKLAQHRRARVESIFADAAASPVSNICFSKRFSPRGVSLNNLTIQFGEAKPLFKKLNLSISAGEFIAITGEDGCGRSTLLRALLQDAPIIDGEIKIGDANYDGHSESRSRRHVRYVGQNPVIFRGSIIDNLTLFGEIPVHVALAAAKFIGLDGEVASMPLGYDTILKSAAGRDIPAPTAQRITLTRVLAMRPSVLVLDEANTLLDMSGEQQFIEALGRLKGKVTTIIATHRPSLLRLADNVYEIRDGQLIRTGADTEQRKKLAG